MVLLIAITVSLVILVFPRLGAAQADAPGPVRLAATEYPHDNRCFAAGLGVGGLFGVLVSAGLQRRKRRYI
jgi:glutamine cyclotransferase